METMGDEPKEYVRITQMDDGRLLIEPATVPTFAKEIMDAANRGELIDLGRVWRDRKTGDAVRIISTMSGQLVEYEYMDEASNVRSVVARRAWFVERFRLDGAGQPTP